MSKQWYFMNAGEVEFLGAHPTGPFGRKGSVIRVISSFDYPPLRDSDHIRLLHLHPPFGDALTLRGSLQVHKLDEKCEYEAISYAWGDSPKSDGILFLNGQILKISRNLYLALLEYRHPDRTRVLWVDAICINQADSVDKSHQVAMMADIYSKATKVLVWLAPAFEGSIKAMEFMTKLASKAISFGIGDDVDRPRLISSFPSLNISNDEAMDLVKEALQAHVDHLLWQRWFYRVWIVQEVALATTLVVFCGHMSMSWTAFAQALEVLRGAFRKVPMGEEHDRIEGIKPAWALVSFRDDFRFFSQYCDRDHHAMTRSLWDMMSNRSCTNDRDRVYAMLAMTKSPYPMTPDYSMSVAQTFTEFTRNYSPVTSIHFAGLCRRQLRPDRKEEETCGRDLPHPPINISDPDYLPSWVPEYRPSLNLAWAWPFGGTCHTADQAPFFFWSHREVRNVMFASGTIFDTIAFTTKNFSNKSAPLCMYDLDFFFTIRNQLKFLCDALAVSVHSPDPSWLIVAKALTGGISDIKGAEYMLRLYSGFESLSDLELGSLPWLTAVWACFSEHCLEPTGEVFQHILLKSLGAKPQDVSPEARAAFSFLVYVTNTLVPNVLFLTEEGYVGLTSRDVRRRDFIAVFNGCDHPYVVRSAGPVNYKEKIVDGLAQVMGPCYLHGIMKGEIFSGRDTPQFSKLKWTRHDTDRADSLDGWLMLI